MEPKQSPQKSGTQVHNQTSQTNPTAVRTYVSDIARMIAENKLSAKEIEHIDPAIIAAVKQFQVQGHTITKPQVAPAMHMVKPEPFIKTISGTKGEIVAPKVQSEPEKVITHKPVDIPIEKPVAKTVEKPVQPVAPVVPAPSKPEPKPEPKPAPKPVTAPIHPPISQPAPSASVNVSFEDKLKNEERELKQKIDSVHLERAAIETKEQTLVKEKSAVETQGAPLKAKEVAIEKTEEEIARLEMSASSSGEKKALQQKRWSLEDERQRIERERWSIDQKITDITEQIDALEKQKTQVVTKETTLAQALAKVQNQEATLKAIADKSVLAQKLADIKVLRAKLETDWNQNMKRQAELRAQVEDLQKKEDVAQGEIASIDQKEHQAKDGTEEHKYELERWQKDVELRKLEEQETAMADDVDAVKAKIAEIETSSQQVLHQEKEIKDQIAKLEELIRGNRQS